MGSYRSAHGFLGYAIALPILVCMNGGLLELLKRFLQLPR